MSIIDIIEQLNATDPLEPAEGERKVCDRCLFYMNDKRCCYQTTPRPF